MQINLVLADENPVSFEVSLDLSSHEGVREVMSLSGPVSATGEVRLTEKGEYLLESRFQFEGETTCSRCLRPIRSMHDGQFSLILLPRKEEPTEDEHSLSAGELDLAYYEDKLIDLDPLVADQVVLTVPMKPLCREDCLGICPSCGANRNETPCACEEPEKDSRWKGLEALKKNLER